MCVFWGYFLSSTVFGSGFTTTKEDFKPSSHFYTEDPFRRQDPCDKIVYPQKIIGGNMLNNIPDILVSILIGGCGWLIMDKLAGVKEVDTALGKKIDELIGMFHELRASLLVMGSGVESIKKDIIRLENRIENLENTDK